MGELIDLAAVGRASRPLARWWDKLLEHGDADLLELERARRARGDIPPQPERLGRAVALVTHADLGVPAAEMIDAVELLCLTASRGGEATAVGCGRSVRCRAWDPHHGAQLALPGLE